MSYFLNCKTLTQPNTAKKDYKKWACVQFLKGHKRSIQNLSAENGNVSGGWKDYYFACTGEGRLLLIFCFEFGEELSPSSESFDDVITERRIKIS